MRKTLTIFLIITLLFLSACSDNKNNAVESINSNDTRSISSGKDAKKNDQTKYAFLIDDTYENTISIQIPLVKENSDQQLLFIQNVIKEKIKSFCGEEFNLTLSKTDIENKNSTDPENLLGYYIITKSKVSYESKDMVSIVFESFFNKSGTAHPTDWLFSINYNPTTFEIIAFSDMYYIDEKLYNIFAQYAEKEILKLCDGKWPDGWGSFSETLCSKENFLQGMKTETEFAYYYTNEGIGISYPIGHALGDHKEVVIPFADLVSFKK